MSAISPTTTIEGQTWQRIDFSGSDLRHLRFMDCRLVDCVFDRCSCEDWRLWKTTVEHCSFRDAKLRESMLGAVLDGTRNVFRRVDFSGADLRRTGYFAAEFDSCVFGKSKLKNIDFRQSSFVDCNFEGELNEVVFNRFGFEDGTLPKNEMIRIDMTKAKLRFVEFRNLDLDSVLLPRDDDHLLIESYPEALDRIMQVLRSRTDLPAHGLAAFFEVFRKWAGRRGVINRKDVLELASEDIWADVLRAIGK